MHELLVFFSDPLTQFFVFISLACFGGAMISFLKWCIKAMHHHSERMIELKIELLQAQHGVTLDPVKDYHTDKTTGSANTHESLLYEGYQEVQ